ncbi:MAG: 7TM diverse intracellular signaling domain-containing protein [Gammaproteobacteria bacterium]
MHFAGLCLLAIAAAGAQPPPGLAALDAETRKLQLREQLELVRDDSGEVTFDGLGSDAVVFRPATATDNVSHGYTSAAYWYRVTLRNDGRAGDNADWVLVVDYPPLDHVDFYVSRGRQVTRVRAGDRMPQRDAVLLDYRAPAIALRLAPGEQALLHVRVQAEGSHQAPLVLWSQRAFTAKVAREHLGFGMFFGLMLVMALYNFCIWLLVRDHAYLLYIGGIVCFGSLQWSLDGFLYQYGAPYLAAVLPAFNRLTAVLVAGSLIFFILFARAFLQTRLHLPRTHLATSLLLAVLGAALGLGAVLPYGTTGPIVTLLATITALAQIAVGVIALRARVRTARFYLLAWTVFFAGILVKALEVTAVIQASFLTAYAYHIGMLITVTLLSLALADRINIERKEKAAAQAEALRAREQAIDSLARYQRIVEAVPEGIFETDMQGKIISANPALVRMLGYADLNEMRRFIHDLRRDPVRNPAAADDMIARLRAEGQLTGHEIQLMRADGSVFWAALSIQRRVDVERGALAHGIVQDITGRREREELTRARTAAEAATTAKSDFLARMSHELRTPMNAIIGFTDLALRGDAESKRVEHLGHIRAAARSLLRIINDILDLSKVEAGKLALEQRDFDLQEVLDHVHALLAQQAKDKALRLSVACAEPTPRALVGDPLRLEQVLVNLVGNAVKFTDKGEVELTVELASATDRRARLRFMVRDTGVGLSQDAQARLFTPFTQVDAFSTRRHGGTGLGLAITRQLVEKMGGRIAVESLPGVGSVFLFTAEFGVGTAREPRAAAAPPAPAASAVPVLSAHRTAVLRGARVLLVEDNALNRQLVTEILQPTGIVLDIAESGTDAIAAVRQAAYNAVLMDVQMPGMDGLEATRRIRSTPGGATLPIVALTANAMERDREDCLASGMNDFITKPVDSDQLLLTLSHWIGGAIAPMSAPRRGDTGPQPQATPPPTLPATLPGIDLALAVKRLGGRESLVLDVLHGMLRQFPESEAALRATIAAGKTDDAQLSAHTLKGLAATAGCTRLSSAARELESALRAGTADPLGALAELAAAFAEVRESAARLPAAGQKARPVRSGPIDVGVEMKRLAELLRTNDSAAQEQVDLLLPALRAHFPGEVLDVLARSVQSFDFDTPKANLEKLAEPGPARAEATAAAAAAKRG